jgi:predicted dithiol-disulfide oxidoreductase (DUF899 family)
LFDGRRQLIVQHFMFAPEWDEGCANCSYMADHTDGTLGHLAQRDVTMVAVARAPLDKIERFRKRMGWRFKWVSSHDSDFNYDFDVSFAPEDLAQGEVYYNLRAQAFPDQEAPGISVFYKSDEGEVFMIATSRRTLRRRRPMAAITRRPPESMTHPWPAASSLPNDS